MRILSIVFWYGLLLMVTTSSCVIFNKLQYLEPTAADSLNWEKGWTKHENFKNYYFKTTLTDSLGKDIGLVTFEFYSSDLMLSRRKVFVLGLKLEGKNDLFIKKIDLDSTRSKKIRDSLKRKGTATTIELPYKQFYIVGKSNRLRGVVSEFMGYPSNKYRDFSVLTNGTFQKNERIKIITGDRFLDSVLRRSSFIFRIRRKADVVTALH